VVFWRRLTTVTAGSVAGAVAYAAVVRPWTLHWGCTDDELRRALPGDDLVPDPLAVVTRSVSIAAPAAAVWPWIAQIGAGSLGRAGWYSYDRFDNAGVPSARSILPGVTAPAVGDTLVPDPAFAWTVRSIEPGRHLVLELRAGDSRFRGHVSWALVLEADGEGRTRLVERSWWDMRPRVVGRLASLLFEPVDFLMMRRHLLNVRERATRTVGSLIVRPALGRATS
jgi:hypothetical protein